LAQHERLVDILPVILVFLSLPQSVGKEHLMKAGDLVAKFRRRSAHLGVLIQLAVFEEIVATTLVGLRPERTAP
jgi:hypothetical protein